MGFNSRKITEQNIHPSSRLEWGLDLIYRSERARILTSNWVRCFSYTMLLGRTLPTLHCCTQQYLIQSGPAKASYGYIINNANLTLIYITLETVYQPTYRYYLLFISLFNSYVHDAKLSNHYLVPKCVPHSDWNLFKCKWKTVKVDANCIMYFV